MIKNQKTSGSFANKCSIVFGLCVIMGVNEVKPSERFAEITHYNIQAIDNVSSIMRSGLLSYEMASRVNHVSIAMEEVQTRRDSVQIPNGLKLHPYANLYFDPRNPMLSRRRNQNRELCILKFDIRVLDLAGVIVSDKNASSNYAAFYEVEAGLKNIDFNLVYAKYWTDDNYYEECRKKSIKCAEVLVPHSIPYEYVISAAVVNNNAKVRLETIGFDREIIIKPREFF